MHRPAQEGSLVVETARTPTLFTAELRWRRPMLALHVASALAVVSAGFALLQSSGRSPYAALALATAAALVASNRLYMATHARRTTIGMAPVAGAALGLAGASALALAGLSPLVRSVCLVIAGAGALLGLVVAFWFVRIRSAYRRRTSVAPDAALIVLGGAIRRGRPCTTLALRLDIAARLWEQAPRRTIVVTGGPAPGQGMSEAEAMARYLQERGVSPHAIILEPQALNTRENITLSCHLLDARGFAGQRCVVSSDYHLWRAKRDARRLGVPLTAVAAPTPWAGRLQQWCREVLTIMANR